MGTNSGPKAYLDPLDIYKKIHVNPYNKIIVAFVLPNICK